MTIKVFREINLTIVPIFMLLISSGGANAGGYPEDAEIKYLPRYCQVRLRPAPAAEKKLWIQRIGRKYWTSFHHYCQYVNMETRYNKTFDKQQREKILRETIKGMTKVLAQYDANFVLMYDGYFRIGKAHARLGNVGPAITFFEKSLNHKPEFIRGYRELSETYRKIGDLNSALDVIERGLKKIPSSKSLKLRKSELKNMLNNKKS